MEPEVLAGGAGEEVALAAEALDEGGAPTRGEAGGEVMRC